MTSWHIITGEYPPQPGGVSDYTRLVARGLAAAGDRVTVWAPPCATDDAAEPGVVVRRLPDRYGQRALRMLDAALDSEHDAEGEGRGERRAGSDTGFEDGLSSVDGLHRGAGARHLLVQYVPHAFGWKALNVPFCWWLRSRRRDSLWIMFHEVAFPFEPDQPIALKLLALITRRMAAMAARAAERAFVSIPAWAPLVRTLVGPSLPIDWLPVPSAIPVIDRPEATAAVRARIAHGGQPVVGHFGTYGDHTRIDLEAALAVLIETTDCRVLLLGRGSDAFAQRFASEHTACGARVHGAGMLTPGDVSVHLSACDVMLQPYPDGVSSRRTSTMAALAHGRAVVTTDGALTEPLWRESSAVVLSPAGDPRRLAEAAAALLADRPRAARCGARARELYCERFSIAHTIDALRDAVTGVSRAPSPGAAA